MSKKIEVKVTKKKGRMLVAKEQIEPGKHFLWGFQSTLGSKSLWSRILFFYKTYISMRYSLLLIEINEMKLIFWSSTS